MFYYQLVVVQLVGIILLVVSWDTFHSYNRKLVSKQYPASYDFIKTHRQPCFIKSGFYRGVDFGSFKFDIHNASVCTAAPRDVARGDRICNENFPPTCTATVNTHLAFDWLILTNTYRRCSIINANDVISNDFQYILSVHKNPSRFKQFYHMKLI